jgi:hypothetical protein
MAMSMEYLAVAQRVCPTHAFRDDVIDLPDISVFEGVELRLLSPAAR